MGFTRAELEAFRDHTLPDLVGPDLRLLFVGINPGLMTVAVQTHFGRPGNRFYPALRRAGITDGPDDLTGRGVGITNLVARATARADELSAAELRAGAVALADKVARLGPAVVAVLGITAYRTAFARPRAVAGRQPDGLGGAQLWVLPNPSGLNAHETPDSLAAAYREAAVAAGLGCVSQVHGLLRDVQAAPRGVLVSRHRTPL
ncbi:mismatch-specific DNA-glycosylase [Jiangella alba]|uniref:G/U mismatch-specific uracil-DNA glycosylase n=1 Tax=Jiangella alba TaxID=561176 RepID=A0A1H5PX53_9ACTN|nr:mismatch-specific DNA-glycosylase [Jiangella alba]SEF18430.1 G/U mismatch-specific uracil-DNA glycosylase [Jiangella alba]